MHSNHFVSTQMNTLFLNQHDDGGPMPRAGYNEARDAVVVRSLVVNPVGPVSYEYDEVRSMRALRELLGY